VISVSLPALRCCLPPDSAQVPGEDPMLTGQYAQNFIKGLQLGEVRTHWLG
jgi:hypothetical protein